jgi:hypothetical protein
VCGLRRHRAKNPRSVDRANLGLRRDWGLVAGRRPRRCGASRRHQARGESHTGLLAPSSSARSAAIRETENKRRRDLFNGTELMNEQANWVEHNAVDAET